MSHQKDTDYLALSARIRVMETKLLTQERMERMIDAADNSEVWKILAECGYREAETLEESLTQTRVDTFKDLKAQSSDPRLVEIFQLKYDYHNAKVILKANAQGLAPERLLLPGGRYAPLHLLQRCKAEDLRDFTPLFRQAIVQGLAAMNEDKDPQKLDLLLDRACHQEMTQLARESESTFLQGYVRLAIDAANLRTAVRVARMGKDGEFLRQSLLPGGNVAVQSLSAARGEGIAELFSTGALAQAAALAAKLTSGEGDPLTTFERACEDALTGYLAAALRIPFGGETVVGFLWAKEAESSAIRTIFAGRAAGLDGSTIRSRLRQSYV